MSERFVCVRITNMLGVDLQRYTFDYDLTFAVLLMHSDGTVFHRYGGRPHDDASSWLSMASLTRVMEATVEECRAHEPRELQPPGDTIEDHPLFAEKLKTQRIGCAHCHNIHDARTALALKDGSFDPASKWIWPTPLRIGLRLDRDLQDRVVEVRAGSAAEAAGVEVGDRIETAGAPGGVAQRILTITDLQHLLNGLDPAGAQLELRLRRGDERLSKAVDLGAGWRRSPPEEYAWRPFKWGLRPAPGFGGLMLSAAKKREQGIEAAVSAFAINYFVTWGAHARRGRAATKAGLRDGDVVIAVDGKDDFESIDHFHAWVRLTKKVGDTLTVTLRRGDETMSLSYALPK